MTYIVSDSKRAIQRLLLNERLFLEERERHEYLSQRRQDLETELQQLHREITEVVGQLERVGRGRVEFGDLRRLTPISPVWGLDRGIPLDRYYIHAFLNRHRADIQGRVLEVKDAGYTRMFGDDRVIVSDVLDINPSNKAATLTGDLSQADSIPTDRFDCFILTQTLGVIFDVAGALRHAARILKPGGVLLCTVPASGRISYEEGLDGDYWRFTEASVRRLFSAHFPIESCEIAGHGNVLAAAAFLYGLAPDELTQQELDTLDPYFPVVYTIRAVKPLVPFTTKRAAMESRPITALGAASPSGIVLRYHRVADHAVDRHGLCVGVDDFRAQMNYLRDAGYRVTSLDHLAHAGAREEEEDSMPAVALTFDDGYLDSLTTVAPILAECGFPGTFFITGAALDGSYEFWWDLLERVFLSGHRLPDSLSIPTPDGAFECQTATMAQRADTHRQLAERFYRLDRASRDEALQAVVTWSGLGPRPAGVVRTMTADEVKMLSELPGVSIGAHSQHHLWLPVLSDDEKRAEVESCKARLEMVTRRRVSSFAYPYGAHDSKTEPIVRAAGFEVAVTTVEEAVSRNVNTFSVPRVSGPRGGAESIAKCLSSVRSSAVGGAA